MIFFTATATDNSKGREQPLCARKAYGLDHIHISTLMPRPRLGNGLWKMKINARRSLRFVPTFYIKHTTFCCQKYKWILDIRMDKGRILDKAWWYGFQQVTPSLSLSLTHTICVWICIMY